jgi:hypothetical protein
MRTLAVFVMIAGLAGASAFNDPQGRYTLDAPAGWKTTQLSPDAVQLMVMVLPGAEPGDTEVFLEMMAIGESGSSYLFLISAPKAADRSRIMAQSNQNFSKIIHDSYENKKKSDGDPNVSLRTGNYTRLEQVKR